MKPTITTLIVAVVTVLLAGAASGHTYTFTGAVNGQWNLNANWTSNTGPTFPVAGDIAIIPDGETCYILSTRAEECDSIQVQSGGALEIRADDDNDGELTISEDSVVDGRLVFAYYVSQGSCSPDTERPAILRIDESLTISGDGGFIIGGCRKFLKSPGLITGPSGAVLTIQNDAPGVLTVKGQLEIEIELVNNARVGVGTQGVVTEDDKDEYVLRLTDRPKSGSGVWAAYQGTLEVNYAVSGAGSWVLERVPYTSAILRINAACVVSGDVTLHRGTFDVQADFCSTGDAQMTQQQGEQGEKVFVNVADGKTLSLGGSCVGTP